MKYNSCPVCEKPISWRQRWKFTKGISSRKSSPCPHCGTMLVWSKWPHRLISTGILFFFIFALLQLLRLLKVELWNAVVGLFTLKLEVTNSDKE